MVYRYGRVNYVLAKRLDLLNQVQKLQESLKVSGDVSYTCETAGYFYLYQVQSHALLNPVLNLLNCLKIVLSLGRGSLGEIS